MFIVYPWHKAASVSSLCSEVSLMTSQPCQCLIAGGCAGFGVIPGVLCLSSVHTDYEVILDGFRLSPSLSLR